MSVAIENPLTGQTMRFRPSTPDRLEIESTVPPGGEAEVLHVHPKQESGCTVLSGRLHFIVDAEDRDVGPGETVVIGAGVPHRFVNEGAEPAETLMWFAPALRTQAFFEYWFGLARSGKLGANGMPNPLRLAAVIPAYSDEIRVASPPWPVQRAFAAIVGPVARALGYGEGGSR